MRKKKRERNVDASSCLQNSALYNTKILLRYLKRQKKFIYFLDFYTTFYYV
jgi:hypothetical protein